MELDLFIMNECGESGWRGAKDVAVKTFQGSLVAPR